MAPRYGANVEGNQSVLRPANAGRTHQLAATLM
ncbi:hypothetical protein RCH17_001051 [Arthrobacter sp. MP_M7]|nr:hypothetical protein [Arthrobacter sp. MP_M4]MEC5202263.1 hypothetical protein [Arthrobacter sp. MP_M7]